MGIDAGRETTLRVSVQAVGYEPLEHDITLQPEASWPVLELAVARKRADADDEKAATDGTLPSGFVGPGLVSCWRSAGEFNGANTTVCRGVPVTAGCHAGAIAAIHGDGRFRLRGAWQQMLLCLQRPGLPPTLFWPVRERADTHVPIPTGTLSGRVTGVPTEAFARCHVVLFCQWLPRRTVQLRADGTFEMRHVAAGKYSLRVGDDDFYRVRAKLTKLLGLDDYEGEARPSLGALEITVRAGETTAGVELVAD